ncbi:Phthalate 4,5-dioxygenase oxygenase subunit [compost metagenome]
MSEGKLVELLGLDDTRYYDRTTCKFSASWADTFGQNRERMLENWTGLRGVEVEDAAIALSQGPLYDRSKEHLVPADQAVMRVRRVLLDSVKRVMNGEAPVGVGVDLRGVMACDAQLPDGGVWQELVPSHRQAVLA